MGENGCGFFVVVARPPLTVTALVAMPRTKGRQTTLSRSFFSLFLSSLGPCSGACFHLVSSSPALRFARPPPSPALARFSSVPSAPKNNNNNAKPTQNAKQQQAQQNFVVTEPSLPDNPIVFASDGFLKLTGYTSKQARSCSGGGGGGRGYSWQGVP